MSSDHYEFNKSHQNINAWKSITYYHMLFIKSIKNGLKCYFRYVIFYSSCTKSKPTGYLMQIITQGDKGLISRCSNRDTLFFCDGRFCWIVLHIFEVFLPALNPQGLGNVCSLRCKSPGPAYDWRCSCEPGRVLLIPSLMPGAFSCWM